MREAQEMLFEKKRCREEARLKRCSFTIHDMIYFGFIYEISHTLCCCLFSVY